MLTRKCLPQDVMDYLNISALCFEWPHDTKGKTALEYYEEALQKRDKADNAMDYFLEDCLYGTFTDEGILTSGIAFMPFTAQFDGHMVKMNGVGGVCTLPEYRRTGGIRSIFQLALRDQYQDGTVFSYLYPFSQSYYEKFGYSLSNPVLSYTISLRHILPTVGGHFTLYRGGDTAPFEKAYSKMRYNLMLKRDFYHWAFLKGTDPFAKNTYAYLLTDDLNQPNGYIIFKKGMMDGSRYLDVREVVYDSPRALGQLMTFLAGYAADYPYANLRLPMDAMPELYCTDMVLSGSKRELCLNGMQRVINVEKALELAQYRGNGEVAIKVQDDQIAENSATFKVIFTGGRAVSVSRTQDEADIQMDIRVFSAALVGRYDAGQLFPLPNVRILNEAALEQVFYRKPLFINNYF